MEDGGIKLNVNTYVGLEIFFSKPTLSLQSLESLSSIQLLNSCPILCNPTDCSTPDLSAHHQLPEFTQTHVRSVGDAIQLSHSLSSPSPPSLNVSQHQGVFK